jgi:hypothetical protein
MYSDTNISEAEICSFRNMQLTRRVAVRGPVIALEKMQKKKNSLM